MGFRAHNRFSRVYGLGLIGFQDRFSRVWEFGGLGVWEFRVQGYSLVEVGVKGLRRLGILRSRVWGFGFRGYGLWG